MITRQEIVDYIRGGCKGEEGCGLLGVEVEHFVVAGDGTPISYNPMRDLPGVRDLLSYLSQWYDQEEYNERGDLMGLAGPDGTITLEPAAQLEIGLPPFASIAEIDAAYGQFRERMGSFAKPFGAHLENRGYHPSHRAQELPLIPKRRYELMDRYFAGIGSHGMRMMRASASTQISIDYASEADAVRKMRVASALAPVLAAIADNTRTFEGRANHIPIRRLQLWREVDNTRCGTIANLFDEGFGFDAYADWLLRTPSIMQAQSAEHLISLSWPDVRLKQFVEIRPADCLPAECVAGYAALIKGLFYSEASLLAVERSLGVHDGIWPLSPAAVGGAIGAIQADGLDGSVYGKSLRWWENKLFALAREALPANERPFLETLACFAADKSWWYVGDARVVSAGADDGRHERRIAAIREGYVAEDAFFMEHKRIFPRRAVVYDLIAQIRALLFPGYFDDETPAGSSTVALVGERLLRVERVLAEQVRRALLYEDWTLAEDEALERANAIVEEFLDELPRIQSLILKDAEAAFEGDPAARSREEVILTYPGMYATLVHRIAHELFVRDVPLIPRLMSEEAHSKTGIDIAPGATIGEYFFIDHGTGVVIGETTVIGHHAKIYQGVTLGATSTRKGQQLAGVKRHPTLGDYVTVYSNASVLGGDTYIGSGSVIGGSAFVCESVPENARVGVKDQEIVVRRMGEPEPVWCYQI
ncbi:MAG: glutamate-cysteine ligase family protein [Coriobacteriales bacterium]|nr:glutamate-cysteine ligase family protein [Coriobacteriales bacterium]